jgi:hypothetical protein
MVEFPLFENEKRHNVVVSTAVEQLTYSYLKGLGDKLARNFWLVVPDRSVYIFGSSRSCGGESHKMPGSGSWTGVYVRRQTWNRKRRGVPCYHATGTCDEESKHHVNDGQARVSFHIPT